MATHIYANGPPLDPPRPKLDVLVRNLELDAARSKRLIDQLLEEDQPAFVRRSAALLKQDSESRGAHYLLRLLTERGLLALVLCDPGLSREQALELGRVACVVAPNADIFLARALAESAELVDSTSDFAFVGRIIEVLGEISDISRILPSLVRVLRHPNPHLRSKTVLTIGRGRRSAPWVRQRLADADPRIRANALESLWDVHTGEARELLQSLVQDPNNRVAGNAILGLYRLGEASVIPEICKLARHESGLFRSTAAWIVGETEDPRFTEVLLEMLRDVNATVRKRAFWALSRLRAASIKAAQAAPCRLVARLLASSAYADPAKPGVRLLLAVTGENGWMQPALLSTHILLSEDGKAVVQYRVTERPLPESLLVVFLLPASRHVSARQSAFACLPWKRPSDLWSSAFYQPEVAGKAGADDPSAHFQANPELIQAEFARLPLALPPPDLWHAIGRTVAPERGSAPAGQQLILVAPAPVQGTAGEDLVAAVCAARAFVQVIAPAPDPALENFCNKTGGLFWVADPAGQTAAVVRAYIQQLMRYEILYQPVNPDARTVQICVHAPNLCGETRIALSPEAASP